MLAKWNMIMPCIDSLIEYTCCGWLRQIFAILVLLVLEDGTWKSNSDS